MNLRSKGWDNKNTDAFSEDPKSLTAHLNAVIEHWSTRQSENNRTHVLDILDDSLWAAIQKHASRPVKAKSILDWEKKIYKKDFLYKVIDFAISDLQKKSTVYYQQTNRVLKLAEKTIEL